MLHAPLGPPGSGPVADGRLREAAVGRRELDQAPAERQGRPAGRLRRRRRPGRVRGRAGRGPAQGQVGRVADPAGSREPVGELPQGGLGREDAGPHHEHAGNFDTAFKSAAKTVSGVVHVPVQRPQPDRPGLRGRRLQGTTAGRTRTRSRCSRTRRTSRTRSPTSRRRSASPSPNQVRVIYYEGSSSFGNGYHYLDIAESAALMSKLAGAPVRLQLMRWDEQGWTRYGPAIMHDMRGGIDDKGNIVAYEAVAFAQASTNDAGDARQLARRRAGRSGRRRHERREPGADVQGREQRARRPGLPARLEDADADDGHVPERHAARAVGPADHVRVGADHRHARRCGRDGSVQLPAPEHPHGRRAGPRGEWPRYAGVLKAAVDGKSGYKPHVSALAARRAATSSTGWGMAIGTHNDSYAATRRARRRSTRRPARSRSSTSGRVRTRASRSTRT